MRYLDSAFTQLSFAIKVMQAAEDGLIELEAIDRPLTIAAGESILVLPDRVLSSADDLVLACQNLVTISYGVAAITLDRCRVEASVPLPNPIRTDKDQWVALVYQIRNAFGHDIAEPRWLISKTRYKRTFVVGPVTADLSELDGRPFYYSHVGGPEGLFHLKAFGADHAFGRC